MDVLFLGSADAPVLVDSDCLQDNFNSACVGQLPLIGLTGLHQDGQKLAHVLFVGVYLRFLLPIHFDGADDPLQELQE